MRVTVARTPAELEAIAPAWDRMAIASPHAGRELFLLVCRATGARPHVTLIEDEGRDPILVVARVERRPMPIKVGYRTLLSVPARWLVVVAGGVVGAWDDTDARVVLGLLREAQRSVRADVLVLSKVDPDGPPHLVAHQELAWFQRGLARFQRGHGGSVQVHHRSDLSGGFDAFLARRSKGTRWRVRRRLRRLDEDSPKLVIRRIGPGDGLDESVRLIDGIAAHSYQRGIGVGFVDDELHRGLVSWALAGGPYRVWTLSSDGVPVAYLAGLVHDRTFHLFETAFDASYGDDEPGAILMARVMEELADEPDIDAFDYGYGDARYKQSFSDSRQDEVDVLGFAIRPRALGLFAISTSVTLAVAAGKRVLGEKRISRLRRRGRARGLETERD